MVSKAPVLHQIKPTVLLALSSIPILVAAILMAFGSAANAHEIRPSIADVTIGENSVTIELALTLEPLIAGLDLTDLQDTNASPLSDQNDALRALEPDELRTRLDTVWDNISAGFTLRAGEQTIDLDLSSVSIPDIGDVELPRESQLRLSAALPADASDVVFGWKAAYGALVVRQTTEQGGGYSAYLTGGELSAPMSREHSIQQPWLTSFLDFIRIGFEHIVPKGLDHILFVLGLFFFSLKMRPLLIQVTAFTLAHTVTLAIATLGWVTAPASIVEPLIAASIVYVAVENIFIRNLHAWRTAVVFGFGLLHGLGFASVLGDVGLDPARFATGLIGFNIGVELGQLAVIAAAFLTVGYWFGSKPWYRRFIAIPASVAIAFVGAYWFVERVF